MTKTNILESLLSSDSPPKFVLYFYILFFVRAKQDEINNSLLWKHEGLIWSLCGRI